MTGRLHAWLRQAHSDLAMAAYASEGGFHAQAYYHCSQAVGKALKALLLALDQEPERTPRSSDCSSPWSRLASPQPLCVNCR